jgi:GH15 family glucan-1,4-alpha-glucosidase
VTAGTILKSLERIWRKPDEGIWEVRSAPRHFTYSKVMAWVAFDRGIKAVEEFGLEGPADHWRQVRDAIRADILANGYDAKRNTFVRHYGATDLDAALLLIAQVGFLPPGDRRFRGTVAAIERELVEDGFVLRYRAEPATDGLPGSEGAFLACSFWLADAYVQLNRYDDAAALFERLLAVRNDLGLLAEQYDPRARRQLGNFPQAFSHVGLVNTAHNLLQAAGPAAQRADRQDLPHPSDATEQPKTADPKKTKQK